ncbi:MAG: hypothetical protein J3Q66DRAFT_2811 [Benniella sp.]|nr:MAG: hypothetical protein J3Q66DRAFT_2811 [Benniella sp.]
MESADTTEVVLLNGLYPSTMRTATAGFESALQHQLDSTTGSAIDSASTAEHQQHQLKNQLQRFAKIPSSVAQTHTRMAPIKVGMGRVDKRKLVSVISSTPFKTATPLGTSPGLSTATATITITDIDNDEDESDSEPRLDRPTNSVQSNSKSRNRNSNSSSTTKHGNHADDSDSDDESEGKTSVMAPREGFTVAYSLFARAKARILHNNNPSQNQRQPKPQQQQQQPQPQQQQPQQQQQRHLHPAGRHPNEKSNDSNGESGASKLSSSEESDSSNACTLPGSDDVLSVGNDSDGTVTDLDGSTNCLRQSKFSFASRPSTPDDTAACTSKAPLVDSTPTVTVTAEVIADDIDDVAETDNLDDDGRDPIERFEEILGRQHHSEEAITASLHELRQMILAYGIPDQS